MPEEKEMQLVAAHLDEHMEAIVEESMQRGPVWSKIRCAALLARLSARTKVDVRALRRRYSEIQEAWGVNWI